MTKESKGLVTMEWSSVQNGARTGAVASEATERPHVLFLVDQLYGLAGAEGVLFNMLRTLPSRNIRCSLATFNLGYGFEPSKHTDAPFYLLPLRRTYDWNALKVALKLRSIIRSERVDVVHTFHETADIWGGLIAKASGRAVLISSRRDMGILRAPKHRAAYRMMRNTFDRVLAVSDQVRSFCMAEDGIEDRRLLTVHNGINLDQIDSAIADSAVLHPAFAHKQGPVIITVANVRRIKGLETLVQAAAIVCKEFPGARFLVAGLTLEPDYLEEVKRSAAALGLQDNLQFLGHSKAVVSLLKRSDVFYLPSFSEGFSNALLEAMACGLPCVATDVGGNKEAVQDGVSGFIVPPGDAKNAAQRVLALLRDPKRAKIMGRAGRTRIETYFTVQTMVDRLSCIYRDVLAERGKPCRAF
jgi:glycosyltransferase involved in cell wall biosynthesis